MPEARRTEQALPHLSVALRHSMGSLTVDVQFDLTQPWTVLFGPSGSGKTTILHTIAGLVTPLSGCIRMRSDGAMKTLLDTGAGVNLPPHTRGTPLAPQLPALFPHLSVRENLEYGGGVSRKAFGTEALLDRFPSQLSGGEARRVSLARAALSAKPRLLLLDEPFTGLDTPLREELIDSLLQLQYETAVPILSVTHDIVEPLRLNAEVIKLSGGSIVAQGPAIDVLEAERAALVSQLQGG